MGIKQHIKKLLGKFRNRQDYALGIYVQEQMITIAGGIILDNGDIRINCLKRFRPDDEIVFKASGDGEQDVEDLGAMIDRAGSYICQQMPGNIICNLCIDTNEAVFYEKSFPQLEPADLDKGVALDFETTVMNKSDYYFDYVANNSVVRIAGIPKAKLKEKSQYWQDYCLVQGAVVFAGDEFVGYAHDQMEYHDVIGEIMIPCAWEDLSVQGAIYSCLAGYQQKGLCFREMPDYLWQWQWLKIGGYLLLTDAVVLGICISCCFLQNQNMTQQSKYQENRLELLGDVEQGLQETKELKNGTERKNKIMSTLQKEDIGAYGLVANMGSMGLEGVWLTSISAEASRRMIIKGRAVNHNAVVKVMNSLENSKGYFQGNVHLISSEMANDNMIDFQINGKL